MAVTVTWANAPSCRDQENACQTRVRVSVANTGKAAVKITEIGVRYPRRNRVEFTTLERLGMVLAPAEEASAYFDIHQMKGLPRYDIIYAEDDTGRKHYPDLGLAAGIGRFLWWQFGYNKPPGNVISKDL